METGKSFQAVPGSGVTAAMPLQEFGTGVPWLCPDLLCTVLCFWFGRKSKLQFCCTRNLFLKSHYFCRFWYRKQSWKVCFYRLHIFFTGNWVSVSSKMIFSVSWNLFYLCIAPSICWMSGPVYWVSRTEELQILAPSCSYNVFSLVLPMGVDFLLAKFLCVSSWREAPQGGDSACRSD